MVPANPAVCTMATAALPGTVRGIFMSMNQEFFITMLDTVSAVCSQASAHRSRYS